MDSTDTDRRNRKGRFHAVAEPLLGQPGLAFAEVLTAEAIEAAFADNDALFAGDDIYSTPLVLWAFPAQALRDGKGAACAAAVADIATYQQQTGGPVPSGDTGEYCRARACAVLSLATGAMGDLAVGPYQGKQTGESALLREILRCLKDWMSQEVYQRIPETLTLRQLRFHVTVPGQQPRQLGFTLACQEVLSSWMLVATDACRDLGQLYHSMLARIAVNVVADRPGRIEPRVIKRRRDHYPLMHSSRKVLRKKLHVT